MLNVSNWKSGLRYHGEYFTYFRTSILTCHTDGKHSLLTTRYWRFKSRAASEQRVFPTITPSGFSMGTILKMNFSRSSRAQALGPVRKSRTPCIIHDDGVSPGWTRAVSTMPDFLGSKHHEIHVFGNLFKVALITSVSSLVGLVMVRTWTVLPARLRQRRRILQYCDRSASFYTNHEMLTYKSLM